MDRAEVRVERKKLAGVKDWARAGGLASAAARVGTRAVDTAPAGSVSARNVERKCHTSRGQSVRP